MFHFELTKTEGGKQVTTMGQQWDTRRDAAFHAMLKFKLALADMETLRDKADHGGISIDGGRLAIKGGDTTPAKPTMSFLPYKKCETGMECVHCGNRWTGLLPFLNWFEQIGGVMRCYSKLCPSNEPGFNSNQPKPVAQPPANRPNPVSYAAPNVRFNPATNRYELETPT